MIPRTNRIAPNFKWRIRKDGSRVGYWMCAAGIAKRGFTPKCQIVWRGPTGAEPTDTELLAIKAACEKLNREARQYSRPTPPDRRRRRERHGFIYFVRCGERAKIGFATDVRARLIELQVGSAEILELLGTLPGSREIEGFVHWLFRADHAHGEWFALSSDLQAFIECHATKWDGPALRHRRNKKEPPTKDHHRRSISESHDASRPTREDGERPRQVPA